MALEPICLVTGRVQRHLQPAAVSAVLLPELPDGKRRRPRGHHVPQSVQQTELRADQLTAQSAQGHEQRRQIGRFMGCAVAGIASRECTKALKLL